jgi:transaldolase/glucose-6-phosphate isomerase
MGGSSLAPEVLQNIYGNRSGYPELIVLDSTHPSAVKAVEDRLELDSSLFIVSSKSGTTLETLSLFRYFWEKVGQVTSTQGYHFIAISDPGSPLLKLARERGFRRVFLASTDVGGRYSAFTPFGLVPAAMIGVDVSKFLDQARIMSENSAFTVPPHESAGLLLGAVLSELAKMGRDKVTFMTSSALTHFPIWLEQLIAESLGKDGRGIVPVVNEPLTTSSIYGSDRVFICFFLEDDDDPELDTLLSTLESLEHPIVSINLKTKLNLSQEIFCWEVAIAAAGAGLGVHPFNQPNVQMAKDLAKKMMEKGDEEESVEADVETISAENSEALIQAFTQWLSQAQEGDYIAIQAYLAPTSPNMMALQRVRFEVLNYLHLATTLGYGPRFLHSTGQLHKGGPNTGLFLQFIDEPLKVVKIPETSYSFNTLIEAQALGDYHALKQLGRRVLRINLHRDVINNLVRITRLIPQLEG